MKVPTGSVKMPGCSESMTAAGVRKAVWREDDVAQDRLPSTTKLYWVKMTDTDTSLLKPGQCKDRRVIMSRDRYAHLANHFLFQQRLELFLWNGKSPSTSFTF